MTSPVTFLLVDDLPENLLSLDVLLRRDDRILLKARSGDEATQGSDEPDGASSSRVDPDDLEQIEDLSESLANDLLDLSIATRQQNRARIGEYIAETITATS